jgi:hypothetical protein
VLDQDRDADIGADQPRLRRRHHVVVTGDPVAPAITPEHFRRDPEAER